MHAARCRLISLRGTSAKRDVQKQNMAWDTRLPTYPFRTCCFNSSGWFMQRPPKFAKTDDNRRLWASTWIYVLSLGLSKLSILAQYLRIFIARRTVQAIWVCIVFVSAYTVQSIIVGILSCNPPKKYWNSTVSGTCINVSQPNIPTERRGNSHIVSSVVHAVLLRRRQPEHRHRPRHHPPARPGPLHAQRLAHQEDRRHAHLLHRRLVSPTHTHTHTPSLPHLKRH